VIFNSHGTTAVDVFSIDSIDLSVLDCPNDIQALSSDKFLWELDTL
jgi:hypothetical protein